MRKLVQHSDSELVLSLRQGDMAAFDELYYRYSKKLMAFALTFFSDQNLAEEAVQEIFVRIWERRKKLCEDKSFKTYLFQSIKFYMYNYVRDKKQACRIEEITQNVFLKECHIVDNLIYEDLKDIAYALVEKLPAVQQQVFRLNKLEGKKPAEIASQMNLSKRTIEHHIFLATKTIKGNLLHYTTISLFFLFVNIFY